MEKYTIHHGDCLEIMREMPDNSVDAVVTDPPYYKVKDDAWDRQWKDAAAFLAWMAELAAEWQRLIRPNGSLYVFASPQMAARVEVVIRERFNVLNHIVWNKSGGMAGRAEKASLRAFFDDSERIIFAEHFGADNIAKGEAGWGAKCDELRGFVFEPLRGYLAGEFKRAGMLNTQGKIALNVACGFSPSSGGMASRHYFSQSQWCLPTSQHYDAMRKLLNANGGDYLRREYEDLRREYEDLRREYEDLRREYEDLRRPFAWKEGYPYRAVWRFNAPPGSAKLHPCQKPDDLMDTIIATSTKPGSVILDCFAGSGSTGTACIRHNRRAVLIEREAEYVTMARARCEAAVNEAGSDMFHGLDV